MKQHVERVQVNMTWRDFRRDPQLKPGVLVWVRGWRCPILIGDVNDVGGRCNCCKEFENDDTVEAVADLTGLIDEAKRQMGEPIDHDEE